MAKGARELALSALLAYRKSKAWADGYLKNTLKGSDSREAALASQITYGVLQNESMLDFYIEKYLSTKLSKLSTQILEILRIGVYQLVYLDRIPQHAAVNEAVKMARRLAPRAAGLVNAVLHRICENIDNLPEPKGDKKYVLALKYSHPEWLVERLLKVYGDDCELILKENNKAPVICARVNILKTNTDDLLLKLTDEGITAKAHSWLSNCITISNTGDLAELNSFKEGLFHICDPASQLAALSLGTGEKILDTCAAPGGKTLVIAQEMGNNGKITACDIHEHRVKLIASSAERLGITNIETSVLDARVFDAEKEERFDAVLCDVPCSGFGVIRKKPEIRFKKENEIARLPEIQLDILKTASKYVKPGGVLIYSTCTILPEENGNVISAFLENNKDFKREEIALSCPNGKNTGEITLLPHKNETDGFFICKLRRK